jgi:hypothetical protein
MSIHTRRMSAKVLILSNNLIAGKDQAFFGEEGTVKIYNQIITSSSADHRSTTIEKSNLALVRGISNYVAICITSHALAIEKAVNRNSIVRLRVRPKHKTISTLRNRCKVSPVILEYNILKVSL